MSIDWNSSRWDGVVRPYSQEDVKRLSGTANIKYTLAEDGSNKLWDKLNNLPYVSALGALTGNQALQQAKAGLDAVYLSGWQVAADANSSDEMYPISRCTTPRVYQTLSRRSTTHSYVQTRYKQWKAQETQIISYQ